MRSSPVKGNKEGNPPRADLYAYYVLGLMTLLVTVNFIDRQLIAVLSPAIQTDLGLTDWQMGAVKGIFFALLYAFLGVPIARLADRTNRINIVATAIASWSFFTMLCGFVQTFGQLALARVGVSVGEAGGTAPAHSILSDYFPKEQRGFALSVFNTGVPLGIASAFIIGGWLVTEHGWRLTFIIMGIPGFVLALLLKFTVREPERGRFDSEAAKQNASSANASAVSTARHMLRIPTFSMIVIGASIAATATYAKNTWIVDFFTRAYPDEPAMRVFVSLGLIQALASTAGIFLTGYFVDRLSVKDKRMYVLLPAATLVPMLPLWAFCLWTQNFWLAVTLQIPIAFFGSCYMGPCFALTQTLSPIRVRAVAAAVFLLIINLFGMGVGPTLVGGVSSALMDWLGNDYSLRAAMTIIVSGYIAATITFLLASRKINEDWKRATEGVDQGRDAAGDEVAVPA
ncbi:MAG: MFS transporter [Parvibaculaceae bacterium]